MSYFLIHPIIIPGKNPITSLLISSEHRRLLVASLNCRIYIHSCCKIVCSIIRGCILCHRVTAEPKPHLLRKTFIYMERPWHLYHWCYERTERVHLFLPKAENSRFHFRVLSHAEHHLEIHSGTNSSLWRIAGRCSQSNEGAIETSD